MTNVEILVEDNRWASINFEELVGSEGRYLFFGKKILEHPNDHLEAFSTSYYAYVLSTRSEKDFSNRHPQAKLYLFSRNDFFIRCFV